MDDRSERGKEKEWKINVKQECKERIRKEMLMVIKQALHCYLLNRSFISLRFLLTIFFLHLTLPENTNNTKSANPNEMMMTVDTIHACIAEKKYFKGR